MELRPYQREQLEAIADQFLRKGNNRLVLKSPTGTGKTVTFAELMKYPSIARWLEQFDLYHRKMLVIAHREELIDQAAKKLQAANPGLMVMIEQGDRRASIYADVVVASIQTLAAMSFRRLHRFLSRTTFRVVIVDEAHHSPAATYRTALTLLGFLPPDDASTRHEIEAASYAEIKSMRHALEGWDPVAPKDRLLVGVTATPNRTDEIGLGCVFQSIAYSYALRQAIADGWLVPIRPWSVETTANLDEVKTTAGDFNQGQLAAAVNRTDRTLLAVAAWQQYAERVPTLAFCVDVAHAYATAHEFAKAGYRAQAISGDTPKDERRMILRQYEAGQIDLIANCMVLTEGTDLPRTGCIVHLKPTKSATLYEQMTGRGLRLFPGKTVCVVIDVVDIAKRHSLQTAPVLYGLPPGILGKGELLDELVDQVEGLDEAPQFNLGQVLEGGARYTLEQLKARASTFDVFGVNGTGAAGSGRATNWVKVGECFRQFYPWALGWETIEVRPDAHDKWEIGLTLKPADGGAIRQRVISTALNTADAAIGEAERFLLKERTSVMRLRGLDAQWRTRPASKKQIAQLGHYGIRALSRTLTMGEASDLIDREKIVRGMR